MHVLYGRFTGDGTILLCVRVSPQLSTDKDCLKCLILIVFLLFWRILRITLRLFSPWEPCSPTNCWTDFYYLQTDVKDYLTTLGMTCGQHIKSASSYWLSRPELPLQINNYTSSHDASWEDVCPHSPGSNFGLLHMSQRLFHCITDVE